MELNEVLKGLIDLSADELRIVVEESKERIVKAVSNEISIGDKIKLSGKYDDDTYVIVKKLKKNYTIKNERTGVSYTCPPGLIKLINNN